MTPMSRSQTAVKPSKPDDKKKIEAPPRRRESARDFVESIVVAFILAFLVRGFEAEAFVIPTGSMAPTLMGMHKEVACPHCGFVFAVNASEDFDYRRPPGLQNAARIATAFCGNCRAPVRIDEEPSFNGDRILVMKFLYDLPFLHSEGPERWDVVVFHYPEEPETNYIKRLVGMPGEDLRIYFGDILTRPSGSGDPYRLQRKPLRHQLAMLQNVWDDRHRPKVLDDFPAWRRWQPLQANRWSEPEPGRFVAKAGADWSDLRYRHLIPDTEQWEAILRDRPLPTPPRPSLVSDYYAYNSGSAYPVLPRDPMGLHWVGDLALSLRLDSQSESGGVRVDLVKGGVSNRVEFDLATGLATLYHGDEALGEPVQTALKGRGAHDVMFANVDGRLTLWVDGATPFGEGREYEDGSLFEDQGRAVPTEADLAPAGVAARGAEVLVSDLVLKRDIYYTLEPGSWDYASLGVAEETILSDPAECRALEKLPSADFPIQPGHYMMFGDNSPRSKDGRGWGLRDRAWDPGGRNEWEVPEQLLIGKAFFVYWPHGKPFWPGIALSRDLRVPFRPYVERMKWIH
jgi:signal peptidase I